MTKTEIAERFGISRQTIYRWIRDGELDRDLEAGLTDHDLRRAPRVTEDACAVGIKTKTGTTPDRLIR